MAEPKPLPAKTRRYVRWTPELWEQILNALRAGNSRTASYEYVGVSLASFYNWLKDEERLADVLQAEAVAETRVQLRMQQLINNGNPYMIDSWLKRRRAKDWAEKQIIEQTNRVGEDAEGEAVDPMAEVFAKLDKLREADLANGVSSDSGE